MKNIRTTILGIAMIVSALGAAAKALFDDDPSTVFDMQLTVTAIASGAGLILAREQAQHEKDNR